MTHGVADRAKPPTPRRRTVLFAPACWAAASLVARPAAGTAARTAAGTAASGATALLIGNSAYRQAPLRRAAGDAQAMAAVLRGMAFDVQLAQDLAWAPMVESMAEWVRRAQDSPLRLFYFAGHGLQAHGRNHLHPVGPAPEHERQLRSRTVDLDEWLERLGRLRPTPCRAAWWWPFPLAQGVGPSTTAAGGTAPTRAGSSRRCKAHRPRWRPCSSACTPPSSRTRPARSDPG
jgi:peptidoglycan/xylan/chitin deacetylase (PgdA/CDA1 family)